MQWTEKCDETHINVKGEISNVIFPQGVLLAIRITRLSLNQIYISMCIKNRTQPMHWIPSLALWFWILSMILNFEMTWLFIPHIFTIKRLS